LQRNATRNSLAAKDSTSQYASPALLGDDDVIENTYADQLARLAQSIGNRSIFAARSGIARWVIVDKQDG
jgi:hypothetical protein